MRILLLETDLHVIKIWKHLLYQTYSLSFGEHLKINGEFLRKIVHGRVKLKAFR